MLKEKVYCVVCVNGRKGLTLFLFFCVFFVNKVERRLEIFVRTMRKIW